MMDTLSELWVKESVVVQLSHCGTALEYINLIIIINDNMG